MEARFASVALAGRVPVKADAGFGAIEAGDLLTVSPTPGLAMKAAEAGPVVGTALEDLASGRGTIQMLVHRGWYGGRGIDLASGSRPRSRACAVEAGGVSTVSRDVRVRELEERVRRLEALLRPAADPSDGDPGLMAR
jgi:hypothetical protein